MGAAWSTQDLSAKYGTPPVMADTQPVAVVHCGYTSVYTVDAVNGDLQETYLPAMGDPWTTQDLSVNDGTPPTDVTPTAVVHSAGATGAPAACGFTSLYTVDAASGHLQETYLPAMGDAWTSQDLSAKYGTPAAQAGIAPKALYHTGYTSVYTVDSSNGHLQESYVPALGDPWSSQALSANDGVPVTNQAPSVLLHYDTDGGLTWTSVFTVTSSNNHLQEPSYPPSAVHGLPRTCPPSTARHPCRTMGRAVASPVHGAIPGGAKKELSTLQGRTLGQSSSDRSPTSRHSGVSGIWLTSSSGSQHCT